MQDKKALLGALIERIESKAKYHGINPWLFTFVYFATLAIFPFAFAWFLRSVQSQESADKILIKGLVAWGFLQAPSLYILMFGRNVPRIVVGIILVFATITGAHYFDWRWATVFLLLLFLLTKVSLRKGDGHEPNIQNEERR